MHGAELLGHGAGQVGARVKVCGAGRGKVKIHGAGQKSTQINCFVSEANIYRTKLDPFL